MLVRTRNLLTNVKKKEGFSHFVGLTWCWALCYSLRILLLVGEYEMAQTIKREKIAEKTGNKRETFIAR